MAKIWKKRIVAGTQFFEDCPAAYRDDVITLLKTDVENGKLSAERYEEITGEEYAK